MSRLTDKSPGLSRRQFIGQASCAALGCSSLLSSLISLKALNAAALANSTVGDGDDYKALVCLFLNGGNDSFNMLVPTNPEDYAEYTASRTSLAIDRSKLLALDRADSDGKEFGLHPAMQGVQGLFDSRKLSFIANAGTLLRPTKRADYLRSDGLPLGLFSHADQLQQWQTGLPNERASVGWGGKVADLIGDMNSSSQVSMNISLSGSNIFQTGESTMEYTIDHADGSIQIAGYGAQSDGSAFDRIRSRAINSMLENEYDNLFEKTYLNVIKQSRDTGIVFSEALKQTPAINTAFSDNRISQSFKMVARTIAARKHLKMKRQIFFIDYGGWDHHDEVLNNQMRMLQITSKALSEFNAALEELSVQDEVLTFTVSEFGRSLTGNGNGTDHGWGGNLMVMGSQVRGGEIYGQYPQLSLNAPDMLQGGILIPTTSADQYSAELALWFGVDRSDLPSLFPNLRNFYDYTSGVPPIGFLEG